MLKNRLLIALLLTAALVGQAVAQQHIHTDDVSTSCLVCAHADTTPAAESLPAALEAVLAFSDQISTAVVLLDATPNPTPRVRGPPKLLQH